MSNRIRRYEDRDETGTLDVWFRSGKATYTFLPTWQTFTYEAAASVFRDRIVANCELWVGERDDAVVAYLAMNRSYIDRLYVDPDEQRRGWGSHLVDKAKRLCPDGLQLHTHQENYGACAFYEARGFKAVRFGISPPPVVAPDVEYHWRP